MYDRTDKRRIYQLIEMYLAGIIDETAFCDELRYIYGFELDYDTLTEEEHAAFSALSEVASRFSPFEEDHKKHPGVHYTKEELSQKISETKQTLLPIFDALIAQAAEEEGEVAFWKMRM